MGKDGEISKSAVSGLKTGSSQMSTYALDLSVSELSMKNNVEWCILEVKITTSDFGGYQIQDFVL